MTNYDEINYFLVRLNVLRMFHPNNNECSRHTKITNFSRVLNYSKIMFEIWQDGLSIRDVSHE